MGIFWDAQSAAKPKQRVSARLRNVNRSSCSVRFRLGEIHSRDIEVPSSKGADERQTQACCCIIC